MSNIFFFLAAMVVAEGINCEGSGYCPDNGNVNIDGIKAAVDSLGSSTRVYATGGMLSSKTFFSFCWN